MGRTGKRNDEEDEYDEYDGEIARGWREGENGDKDITWNGHGIELGYEAGWRSRGTYGGLSFRTVCKFCSTWKLKRLHRNYSSRIGVEGRGDAFLWYKTSATSVNLVYTLLLYMSKSNIYPSQSV